MCSALCFDERSIYFQTALTMKQTAVAVVFTWLAPGVHNSWVVSNMCSGLMGWEKLTCSLQQVSCDTASEPPAARSGWDVENCIPSSLHRTEDGMKTAGPVKHLVLDKTKNANTKLRPWPGPGYWCLVWLKKLVSGFKKRSLCTWKFERTHV